jgi:ketosteroid isomerase-like protein
MSQENVEAFLTGVEAINRGEPELLLDGASEDVVIVALRSAVEGEYRGHEGLRRFLSDNRQAFEVFEARYSDVRDLGDRVLAIGELRIRGRGGGVETTVPTAGIATFTDGRMTMWKDYGDADEALSAAKEPIMRRWVWAFEHDADAFRELTHPEIEWAPFEENHTVSRGLEQAMRIRAGWLDAWAEHRIEIEEVIDVSDGLVLALRVLARGKSSGLQADVRLYPHVRFRDGRAVYMFEYDSRAAALEAVGMTE